MSDPAGSTALADRRRLILDRADVLFRDAGITATSLDDVSRASAITVEELDDCFPTKEILIEAVFDDRHDAWIRHLQGCCDQVEDPRDKILSVFTALERRFAEERLLASAFTNDYGELRRTDAWVSAMTLRHVTRFTALIKDLAAAAGLPVVIASSIALLAEGAQAEAVSTRSIAPARDGRLAAAMLMTLYQADITPLDF